MNNIIKNAIDAPLAPQAIGAYSQAIRTGNIVYFSGQLGIIPETDTLINHDFKAEIQQIFKNISILCEAADGELNNIVKLTVFLTDISNFSLVNDCIKNVFLPPFPARSAVQVSALPRGAQIEIEAIMAANLPNHSA